MDIIQRKTLDWVNDTRFHEFSLPPLEELVPGRLKCADDCVITNCFPKESYVITDGSLLYINPTGRDVRDGNGIEMPDYVREFITNFDAGLYPELDIEATRRTAGYLNRTHD